jgi:hypothetical protein
VTPTTPAEPPLVKLLLVVFLFSVTTVISAQSNPKDIAGRVGPLERHATTYVATALSIAIVGQYQARFPNSDHLDEASWSEVLKQLVILSDQAYKAASGATRGRNSSMGEAFISELEKADEAQLTEIARFLESSSGKDWLSANVRYEKDFHRSVVTAAAHVATSRRRKAPPKPPDPSQANLIRNPPLLILHAVAYSPANEPSLYAVFEALMTTADGHQPDTIREAQQALATGAKSGLSQAALKILMQSFSSALRATGTKIDLYRIQDKEFEAVATDRVKDLVERAFLAADQMQTIRCKLPLSPQILQDIGRDVGKIMTGNTQVRPGSVEHSWIAMSFERGCNVKKDFSIALKAWEDIASTGSVPSWCKLANYYHLGIGTPPDPQRAREWAAKFDAVSQGRTCTLETIHPERPFAGMKR